ncbi:hypothetical protein evm_006920 [Chilo suppressalis]|nr:hypothetical protein evm_006920 [Chilo suppressalis]
MLSQKSSLFNIFDDLYKFDELLNIEEDLDVTFPITKEMLWTVFCVLYTLIEFIYLIMYIYDETTREIFTTLISYVTLLTHDLEHVLICSLLRAIFMRVRILRAHVEKALGDGKQTNTNLDRVEALSKKAQLDLNSLHKAYELLHKSAEQLNSVMSLPMMIMLLSSGLSSIMLLKGLFRVLQTAVVQQEAEKVIVLYSVTRCIKYTFLVIVPCYYSSTTNTQVSQIRILLHDAMNSDNIGKLERRRIKAFFQLTRESEFAYALFGVIRLNMSLPLSYLSLCTTYLVIIIQFSKFID